MHELKEEKKGINKNNNIESDDEDNSNNEYDTDLNFEAHIARLCSIMKCMNNQE